MTDTPDRRMAEMLTHINGMLDSRLPAHLPEKRPGWQFYTFAALVVFYGGATWFQI